MTKNPSRKLPKVFVLIIPLAIGIHISKWEVVVVCRSRTPRGMTIILSQVIQIHFDEWEVAAVYCPRREVGIVMYILTIPQAIQNTLMGSSSNALSQNSTSMNVTFVTCLWGG